MAPIHDWLTADDEEAFDERVAIMALDGGMSIDAGETAARLAFSFVTHLALALVKSDACTQSRVSAANADHGLRRSNEDKRKAVGLLLADAEWSKLSNAEIARLCNVSHTFVNNTRNPPAPKPPTPPSPPAPPTAPEVTGNVSGPTPPPPPAGEATAEPDTNGADAYGDDTTIQTLLDETVKELDEARELLAVAAVADLKAEVMKWKTSADIARRERDDVQSRLVKP